MQKGGIRGAWFETRLHWEVISTHHLPVVGCTRWRKLLFRSFVSKYVSRNLSRKSFATLQGSAILSESIRNRDSKEPGIGIGIESCTSLGTGIGIGIENVRFSLVSEWILFQSGLVYQGTLEQRQN